MFGMKELMLKDKKALVVGIARHKAIHYTRIA